MSLGQLALHVATLPRQLTEFVTGDALDFGAAAGAPPTVSSHQELLAAFASSTEQAQAYLATLSDERATATWRLAGRRPRTVRGTARSRSAVVPVQSLVSPPGTAARLLCDCSTCLCHRSTDPPLTRTRSGRRLDGHHLRKEERDGGYPHGPRGEQGRDSRSARFLGFERQKINFCGGFKDPVPAEGPILRWITRAPRVVNTQVARSGRRHASKATCAACWNADWRIRGRQLWNPSERELDTDASGSRKSRMRVDILHAAGGLASQT